MSSPSYKKRIAILRGGPSSEYDISMRSGAGVLKALADAPYTTKDIIITRKGEWLADGFVRQPQQVLCDIDVVFLALHGNYGEDGTVQRIIERLALPYTGSNSYASSIAINKPLTKDHLKSKTDVIRMAPHMRVRRQGTANLSNIATSIRELFGPEYVIKPTGGGSSIGVRMCDSSSLLNALEQALEENEEVIVEKRILGKEATVGVLENFRNQKYYSLPEIEIVPSGSNSFFTLEAKYDGQSQEICPGRFSKKEKQALSEAAQIVHTALDLKQYSRSDFIVASDGVYFLEVNTLPGLTSESLFPKAMESVGSSYRELVIHLIETAAR